MMDAIYSMYVKSHTDSIKTARDDKRLYRGIEMKNGMKILLVHDSATVEAAASIDIAVGSMSDPRKVQGLAHLCEHMLFCGTKKYPEGNEFHDYLETNAGGTNATTYYDHTNFYFDVRPNKLIAGLERLVNFFLCPLFPPSAVEPEVEAIDCEHKKYVQVDDERRLIQLLRSRAADHDYNKFHTGCRKSLIENTAAEGLDLHKELLKFYNNFYSANIMALCVIGTESLDELTTSVVPIMAEVENKGVERPDWLDHPYGPAQNGCRLDVVPLSGCRSLRLMFPITNLDAQYQSKPGHYVSCLLSHQSDCGLTTELKRRGWATSVVARERVEARDFGFFYAEFTLTKDGLHKIHEIVDLFFGYIDFLIDNGPQEWVYRACCEVNETRFETMNKGLPELYASSLAARLHLYPMENVLNGPYMIEYYNPDLIQSFLKALRPGHMTMVVIAKDYKGITTKIEEWYGTEYNEQKLPKALLEVFESPKNVKSLFNMPEQNDFNVVFSEDTRTVYDKTFRNFHCLSYV